MARRDEELPPMRGRAEREVRDEIGFHLDERAREFEQQGMEPEVARRAAREAFGDPEAVAEHVRREHGNPGGRREVGWTMMLETVTRDLRHAARGLARRPTFTVVAVTTLAVGIGAVAAAFGVANASLIRALPFPDGERIVFLQGAFDAPEGPQVRGASPIEARDWETMSGSFEEVAAYDGQSPTLTGSGGDAERVSLETVDQGYLEILGAGPMAGRAFTADEYAPGNGRTVALVGEDLWTRRWARDPGLVGRAIYIDGAPFTVVGILPRAFQGATLTAEVWVPLASVLSERAMADRGDRWAGVVARLRDGVSVERARRDMSAVTARLAERYPDTNRDRIALVTPARELYLGSTRGLLLVLLGATGLLLLIAVANVANLLLVRSWARQAERTVRRALGAGRSALAREALTETLVLSGLGAGLGGVLGIWGAKLLARAMPDSLLPSWADPVADAAVFGMVAGAMLLVALLTGLAPSLGTGGPDLAAGLRERTAGGGSRARSRLQGLLVAGEVALAVVLLVGAGLMVRSLRAQLAVEPGFDHEALLAAALVLPGERYPDDDARRAVMSEILARLEAEPGVVRATFGSDAPLRGGSSASFLWTAAGGTRDDRIRFYFHRVQPGWFETMGVPIVRGRALEAADAAVGFDVAVISRAMAERHFGGDDPIGRTLFVGSTDRDPITIVGVADDVRWRDLTTDLVAGPTDPDVYVAWPGLPGFRVQVVLRARRDPASLANGVRRAIREVDPDLVPYDVLPMADVLRTQTAQGRFGSLLLGAFSVLAGLLSAVGLYGVLSFSVGRRTREIAVRMAVGADAARVRRLVVRDGMRLAALGVLVGTAVAVGASRSLAAFLFGVRPVDAPTYVAVAILMLLVAGLAAWLPALRATRVDPHTALAGE